jgi:hypothetical protein
MAGIVYSPRLELSETSGKNVTWTLFVKILDLKKAKTRLNTSLAALHPLSHPFTQPKP